MRGPSRISVLSIGDEILSGEVEDDNFLFLASEIRKMGFKLARHVVAPDDEIQIADVLKELCEVSDAVIMTGGLGPTSDDVPREGVARATDLELEYHQPTAEAIREFFASCDRYMPEENLRQAYVPSGSSIIPPAGGTAPGFVLDYRGTMVISLPGVPREMKSMWMSHVAPELRQRFWAGQVTVTRKIMTFGAGESDVAGMLADRIGEGHVSYGFLAEQGAVIVKLTATTADAKEAEAILDREHHEASRRLGSLEYGVDDAAMEEVVGKLLKRRGMTLSVAESLTAGLVCGRIANVPGSSTYFRGGVVTYTIASKSEVLGIPAALLRNGAVNRPVAEAMAVSVRKLFSSDIGVSTTGVAGPTTGGEKEPAGTVCLALACNGLTRSWKTHLPGDRQAVRNIASLAALNALRLYLMGELNKELE